MDYNFFEPIRKKKKKTNMISLLLIILVGALLGGLLLLIGLSGLEYWEAKDKLDTLKSQNEDPTLKASLDRVDELDAENAKISQDLESILGLILSRIYSNTGNKYMIDTFEEQVPSGLGLTDISIEGNSISLIFKSKDLTTVAKFENSLRKTEMFEEDIVINSIKMQDDSEVLLNYETTMELTLNVYGQAYIDLFSDFSVGPEVAQ